MAKAGQKLSYFHGTAFSTRENAIVALLIIASDTKEAEQLCVACISRHLHLQKPDSYNIRPWRDGKVSLSDIGDRELSLFGCTEV